MNTGERLGIPRCVRCVAVVHIAVKRDAVLVADQAEPNLFLPAMVAVIAMGDVQHVRRIGFIRAVNGLVRRIRMEDAKREAFFLVDLHETRRQDLMDIGLIQPIQMTGDGIVVEPRRIQLWPNQFRQIDVMRPPFQMNQGLEILLTLTFFLLKISYKIQILRGL